VKDSESFTKLVKVSKSFTKLVKVSKSFTKLVKVSESFTKLVKDLVLAKDLVKDFETTVTWETKKYSQSVVPVFPLLLAGALQISKRRLLQFYLNNIRKGTGRVSVGVSPRRREKISGRSSAASSALAKGGGGGSAGRGRGKTGGRGPKHKANASILTVTGAFTISYHTETAATQRKCL
jgi:hypothetical protein